MDGDSGKRRTIPQSGKFAFIHLVQFLFAVTFGVLAFVVWPLSIVGSIFLGVIGLLFLIGPVGILVDKVRSRFGAAEEVLEETEDIVCYSDPKEGAYRYGDPEEGANRYGDSEEGANRIVGGTSFFDPNNTELPNNMLSNDMTDMKHRVKAAFGKNSFSYSNGENSKHTHKTETNNQQLT